jgi:hypothetical protein
MFSLDLSIHFLPLYCLLLARVLNRAIGILREELSRRRYVVLIKNISVFYSSDVFFPIRSREVYSRFIIFRVTRGTSKYKKLKILVQRRRVDNRGVLFIPSPV